VAVTIGELAQISFVVDDLDTAMQQWLSTSQTGPFFVLRHLDDLPVAYRGERTPLDISVGFAQMGQVHIELVQQHNSGPSVYRELYKPGSGGLHHICIPVDDFEGVQQNYLDQGFAVGMKLEYGGTPMVYLDTTTAIGCMTELVRADPGIMALYQQIADAAVNWDGTDAVRDL
jgi:hypothetical protein